VSVLSQQKATTLSRNLAFTVRPVLQYLPLQPKFQHQVNSSRTGSTYFHVTAISESKFRKRTGVQSASQPPGQSNIPANSYVRDTNSQSRNQSATPRQYVPSPGSRTLPSTNVGAPPSVPSAASYEPGVLPPLKIGFSVYTANSN